MTKRDEHPTAIVVHIYGKLAEDLPDAAGTVTQSVGRRQKVLSVDMGGSGSFGALLARLDIAPTDLYTVFLNGSLLTTRNGMAPWLRYPQAQDNVWNWDHEVELRSGDRIGLFGEDMALLVV